ncbi:hypothetical protein PHYSODRAFT_356221, partial [Phytophthora sojae]
MRATRPRMTPRARSGESQRMSRGQQQVADSLNQLDRRKHAGIHHRVEEEERRHQLESLYPTRRVQDDDDLQDDEECRRHARYVHVSVEEIYPHT